MQQLTSPIVTVTLSLLAFIAIGLLLGEPFLVSKIFGHLILRMPWLGMFFILFSIIGLASVIETTYRWLKDGAPKTKASAPR